MNRSIFITISARLFLWLIISASTDVVCQSQTIQHYAASDVWPNYCPVPANATGALLVRSLISCGVKCSSSPQCVDFSFYSSSGRCYLYGALPPRISYDADCKFMMVWSSNFLSVDPHGPTFGRKPFLEVDTLDKMLLCVVTKKVRHFKFNY